MTDSTDPRLIREEVLIVLAFSLLPSLVSSIFSITSVPISGSYVALEPQGELQLRDILREVTNFAFSLVPVALVFHIRRIRGESLNTCGLSRQSLMRGLLIGVVAGALITLVAGVGQAITHDLGIQRYIIGAPKAGEWWTYPLIFFSSLEAGLLEEVIVVGYLIPRLEQLRFSSVWAVVSSAIFRGSYHLYQGWGGFLGSTVLGLVFGAAFIRWRKTWPLVAAHFTIDFLGGILYLAFRGDCLLGMCF